uniref:Uncharacterized protein n=1 Tax=Caenorhabditis japonica TaxID=281687 RepID=A0A8R1EF32_CAEJA
MASLDVDVADNSDITDNSPPSKRDRITKEAVKRGRPPKTVGRPQKSTGLSAQPSLILSLMSRVAKLENIVTELAAEKEKLKKTMKEQDDIIRNLRCSLPSQGQNPATNINRTCPLYADIVKKTPLVSQVTAQLQLASNIRQYEKKSFLAVIENLEDDKTDGQSAKDKLFLNSLSSNYSLPTHTDTFRVKCRNPDVFARPTKVRFETQSDRDTFIRNFSKCIRSLPSHREFPRPLKCRRDMTLDELTVLRNLRKTVYEANFFIAAPSPKLECFCRSHCKRLGTMPPDHLEAIT